ncbi:MAG: DUF1232 domain-containing protein [Actinobacteria bacterium]|nr:DUF1232 domain-containing protein [Actinomycetota bacterium]
MLRTLAIVAATFVVVWLLFILFVFAVRPDSTSLREAARLLPDTLRLIRRLAGDREIPRVVRWPVWLLIAYLAMPIDLIPDFLPVLGYADDAILTSFVLRLVIRRSGPEKLRQHWPGSPEGLAILSGLLRLGDSN